MPGVSVIIPSYNHEKYVVEAIQSVLEQTYQDFEIVITDDGSTDGTVHEIKKFDDLRIRLYTFEKNQGACVAVNHCLHHAKGEYIAVLSSDDQFLPEKLEKQVKFLDKHPEIGAVFGFAQVIDDSGRDFADWVHFYYDIFKQPNRTRYEWLNHFFYKGNCLCHPSILIRKTCYNTIGLYDPRFAQLPDFDFWIRLCMQYDIHIIQENLIKFRVRAGEANVSGRRPDSIARSQWEILQIYKHYLQIPSIDEFLRIFPEAEKCVTQHPENNFVPALVVKLALDSPSHILHCFAINTLFDLLKDKIFAEKLYRQYGLTYHDLIKLAGKYEITPLSQTFAQLFIDTGFGFNEKQSIKHEIAQLETRLEFDLSNYDNIVALRFDPLNSMVVLKLKYIKIITATNTLHRVPYSTNALYQKGSLSIFDTTDPIIYIYTKNIFKPKTVVIQLEYVVWGTEVYRYIAQEQSYLLQCKDEKISQQQQTIQGQEQILQQQARQIYRQARMIRQQKQRIQAIENTLSWRITKPLRTIWNICRLDQFFPKPELTSNNQESPANINKAEIKEEITTDCGSIKPIREPNQELIDYVGGGSIEDYRRIGLLNFYLLIFYCHLQPSDRILEPGCGVGRNAQVIAPYLAKGAGIYEGFDICHSAIQWATENITRPYPNVRFTYVDILNDHYNKNGKIKATEYIFPYESEYFDIVFLPSVFTHMMKDEHEHYIRQIIRVLKRGGLLMSWYFLMNDYSKRSIKAEKAPLGLFYECEDVSFTTAPNDPCAVIAYDEKYVFDFYNSVGLDMVRIIYGNWSGKEEGVILDYQDKILLRKL